MADARSLHPMKTSCQSAVQRAAALLALLAFLAWPAAAQPLPPPVMARLAEAGIPVEALGLAVLPMGGSVPTMQHQAGLPMQPASTLKLVTAMAAIDLLGLNHRGRTELLSTGPVRAGVVAGEWALRGQGDTTFDHAALWSLLREWRDSGVQEIRGDLIVDREWFQPPRPDIGVPPFDEAPEWPYNTVPDALSLNASLLRFHIASDAAGQVQLRSSPQLPGLRLVSQLTPGTQACRDWDDGWQTPLVHARPDATYVVFRGSFPPDCQASASLNMLDRQWVLAQLVRRLWGELGGVWVGQVREGRAPAGARVVASHRGPALAEMLRPILKFSDNPITRIVYASIGAVQPQEGEPTQATADRRVLDWMATQGVDPAGVVLDNGSGLSRSARISPLQLAQLLQRGLSGPLAPELLAAMPIVGVDGTMRRRLADSPAALQARLKTGTLSNTVALAGRVQDASGRPFVLAVFINHPGAARRARPVLDTLVDWIAHQTF